MQQATTTPTHRLAKRKRLTLWSLVSIVALSLVLPLASYSVYWLGSTATAQEGSEAVNPRSNYWRAVREGVAGTSTVKGEGANVLVQAGGTNWTQLRNQTVAEHLPWVIVGMLVVLLLYHLIHGRNCLDAERLSGRKVPRWTIVDRATHWITAISFIVLAITGLSMLIGRAVLIPLFGKAGFALWAQASITIHNVVGPVFTVGITLMIVMWIWYNFPTAVDVRWVKQGGGLFARSHPSAGRMNAGEKLWFWLVATLGVAVCISGLLLVSPIYGFTVPGFEAGRPLMQQANLVHAVGAILWTAVALGHIYIGTAGTEGAFEGMATGYVSEEWAKQHHDLWYEQMREKDRIIEPVAASTAHTDTGSGEPATTSS